MRKKMWVLRLHQLRTTALNHHLPYFVVITEKQGQNLEDAAGVQMKLTLRKLNCVSLS